jgi:hypothetical protein
MIKLEILDINDPTNYSIPRLELWMLAPRKMLVEASSSIEYMTTEEFKEAWRKLNRRKKELEIEYNKTADIPPQYPLDLKKRLKEDIAKIMSRIEEIELEKPRARIIK